MCVVDNGDTSLYRFTVYKGKKDATCEVRHFKTKYELEHYLMTFSEPSGFYRGSFFNINIGMLRFTPLALMSQRVLLVPDN